MTFSWNKAYKAGVVLVLVCLWDALVSTIAVEVLSHDADILATVLGMPAGVLGLMTYWGWIEERKP